MVRRSSLSLWLTGALAVLLGCLSPSARAQDLTNIQVEYNGGPLIQNVHVVTVFYGKQWNQSRYPAYFDNFFQTLFDDGRFMANLTQYSAGGFSIQNGKFSTMWIDPVDTGDTVTDAQIRAELLAQASAGNLPDIDPNVLYVVFTPPNVDVTDRFDNDSKYNFSGYHDYASEASFAYAVIPFDDLDTMTQACSHELAEAVTDPEPTQYTLGWYDDANGEIGDIPVWLYDEGRIREVDLLDHLVAADGTSYVVQKIWSLNDGKPIAFAD